MLKDGEGKSIWHVSWLLFTCSSVIIDDQREDSVVIDLELQPMPVIVVDILAGLNGLEATRERMSVLIRTRSVRRAHHKWPWATGSNNPSFSSFRAIARPLSDASWQWDVSLFLVLYSFSPLVEVSLVPCRVFDRLLIRKEREEKELANATRHSLVLSIEAEKRSAERESEWKKEMNSVSERNGNFSQADKCARLTVTVARAFLSSSWRIVISTLPLECSMMM